MISYKTLGKEAHTEYIVEKSRFIAHAFPVGSREEAEEKLAEVRKQYKDATHNVPAMVIGDQMQIQWASDDGEPQGTSGAPVVQLLTGEGITDALIVVTRYFGGIKLGTGGLVRAYTTAAKLVLEEAGICTVEEKTVLSYVIDYSYIGKIQNAEGPLFRIKNTDYQEKVCIDIVCAVDSTEQVKKLMMDKTNGTCILEDEKTELTKENASA